MNKTGKNVRMLNDGRVEITLLMPLTLRFRRWIKFYVPECELVIENAKIVAIRCHPKTWEETLRSLDPESLNKFKEIIEKGMGKRLQSNALFALEF